MNKLYIIKLVVFVLLSIVFTACSSKVTVKALKPSVVHDKDIKQVSVLKFKNDDISLSSSIESNMNNIKFNDKKYFKIVNRKEVNIILKEQKLQDSGLVNGDIDLLGLSSVKSLITGKINNTSHSTKQFYETRTNYNICLNYKTNSKGKKYCVKYAKYTVSCWNHSFVVSATIGISRVSNSDMIYKETFVKDIAIKTCRDKSVIVPDEKVMYEKLSKQIASSFVSKISPSYDYFQVVLIDDEDIDYSSSQEKLLENGLEMIELNRIQKAKTIFKKLVATTSSKSSTALYGLALCEELLGNLEVAYKLYLKAEDISMLDELNKDISKAVKRVKNTLKNKQKAMTQINN